MKAFIAGFAAPWLINALILALQLSLPAREVRGYVRDRRTGETLSYRLNGPLVLAILVALWVIAGRLGLLPWDWLYLHRWSCLAGSCVLGLVFSLATVGTVDGAGRTLPADLYAGRSENMQFFRARADAKMLLYLAGACMLALNLLSFLAHNLLAFGRSFSPGVLLYCCLFF
jgi:hypothetical protein